MSCNEDSSPSSPCYSPRAHPGFVERATELSSNSKISATVYDRLKSIEADADFVEAVRQSFALPIAVNERCGRWYVRTETICTSAYFKSTDGHTDHCKFSLRRLNMHLMPLIKAHDGIIIVDSTRRGKRIPDALSKTVPIWCCVINRIISRSLSRDWTDEQLALYTPSICVSRNEHETISAQIDAFVESLLATNMNLDPLKLLLKPLRPIWITPASTLTTSTNRFLDADFVPIILVTASRAVADGADRQHGYTYVQGAADDEEMWACGLSPAAFWQHHKELLGIGPAACIARVREGNLATDVLSTAQYSRVTQIRNTRTFVCDQVQPIDLKQGLIIDTSIQAQLPPSNGYKHLPILSGKKGASQLHSIFAQLESYLMENFKLSSSLILTDDENCKSKASIVALLVLTIFYTDDDTFREFRPAKIDKTLVQNRLVTLVNSRAGLNPSRASLKSLNEYLMSATYRN